MRPTIDVIALLVACALLLAFLPGAVSQPIGFAALFPATALLIWLWLSRCQPNEHIQPQSTWTTLPLVFLMLVVALLLPPVLSDDYHRYLWEGHVQNLGFSPYQHAPASLYAITDHPAKGKVNNDSLTAIYPPLAQAIFRLLDLLGGHLLTWKILLLLTCLAAWPCLGWRMTLALIATPLLIIEGFWNAHLDVLGVAPGIWLIWSLQREKPGVAGIMLAAMTAIKIMPIVWLPFCWLHFRGRDRWIILASFAISLSLFVAPYLGNGMHMFDSFSAFSKQWHFNNPLFLGLAATFEGETARWILTLTLMVILCRIFFSKRGAAWQMCAAWIAMMVCSPTVYPWYLIWFIPFFIRRDPVPTRWHFTGLGWLMLAFGAMSLSYLVLIPYHQSGIWREHYGWLFPEWLLLVVCFVAMLKTVPKLSRTPNSPESEEAHGRS